MGLIFSEISAPNLVCGVFLLSKFPAAFGSRFWIDFRVFRRFFNLAVRLLEGFSGLSRLSVRPSEPRMLFEHLVDMDCVAVENLYEIWNLGAQEVIRKSKKCPVGVRDLHLECINRWLDWKTPFMSALRVVEKGGFEPLGPTWRRRCPWGTATSNVFLLYTVTKNMFFRGLRAHFFLGGGGREFPNLKPIVCTGLYFSNLKLMLARGVLPRGRTLKNEPQNAADVFWSS